MLKIENLTKRYGDKKAVDNVSLHIKAGELYGFIGHNGAGKTTTLKACCGILRFDEGEIYVDGISMKKDPLACKKRIAYLPDNPDLYPFMTGVQYLDFVGDMYEVNVEKRKTLTRKYAEALELVQDLAQPVSAYSHGMKQKITIMSALVHDPKLWILDEAYSHGRTVRGA